MDQASHSTNVDLNQDRRAEIVTVSVLTWLLAVMSVAIRILNRRMSSAALGYDDWLIVATVPMSCLYVFSTGAYAVSRGLGLHLDVAPPDSVYAWSISLFVSEIGYFLTLMCVKWSILALYWRLFAIMRTIRWLTGILAVTVLLWGLALILATIFGCNPVYSYWARFDPVDPLPPSEYSCNLNSQHFFYANAIPTIITDIFMLVLPLPYVWQLKLRLPEKVGIIGVFLIGLFVTVVSAVRCSFLLRADIGEDVTWNFVDVAIWSAVEGNIAILCACLPFFRPVFRNLKHRRAEKMQSFETLEMAHTGSQKHGDSVQPRMGNSSEPQLPLLPRMKNACRGA